jgi:signal transduction histidine kinase
LQEPGWSQPVLSRIFDPFYTTKFGQGGSGIGLSICRRIATSILDGDLVAHSVPDQGSTFTLTFQRVALGKI